MPQERRSEIWLIWDSDQIVTGIHSVANCSGPCVVHHPTNHWMRDMPLGFDVERSAFYRVCKHGRHHQDPDERTRLTGIDARTRPDRTKKSWKSPARIKLEQWDCTGCICECCSVVAKYLK